MLTKTTPPKKCVTIDFKYSNPNEIGVEPIRNEWNYISMLMKSWVVQKSKWGYLIQTVNNH